MVSLYFHIPFCKKKCPYCHFYVIADKEPFKERLLSAFKLEWQQISPKLSGKTVETIYFGGGTPTLFGPERLKALLDQISFGPDVEISIETNPEEAIDYRALRAIGINRLSFGVQSLNQSELTLLGRGHSANQAVEAVSTAHAAGFNNITIDLMYDLPGQTLDSWKKSLEAAVLLPITHLSLYNLTIEAHTAFEKKEKVLRPLMPDEETSVQMYAMAQEILGKAGFRQYEISAFCRNNLYSRHNIGYWTGRHFYGLGPSSFSYDGQKRFRNVPNLVRYASLLEKGQSPVDYEEPLCPEKRKRELLALQLRLVEGADLNSFQPLEEETISSIQKLYELGLLQRDKNHLQMTPKGILFYDTIATEII